VIVLDSSAAVEWLLGRAGASEVAEHLGDPEASIHAPSILPVEVMAAVRGLVLGGHATARRGREALDDLTATDVTYHEPMILQARAWELRSNLSTYDATYVALAELLGAVLVTADRRIARAPGLRARLATVG